MSSTPAGDALFAGVTAVLFDVDGTMVDSNDAHTRSWVETFARAGHAVDYATVRALIGKGGDKLLAETVGIDEDAPEGERLTDARRTSFMRSYLHTLRPTAGIRDLLLLLKSRNIRVIVATSAGKDDVGALLAQAGVDDLPDAVVTSDDASQTKPDPDIVKVALRKAGVEAGQALMVGDTPYDIAAATKAGVRTVVLRCGGWWPDDAFGDAVAIFDDPRALSMAILGGGRA